MSELIAFAVKFIMNNHIYVFDGNVYLQEKEGSIGIRLTGLLAEIIMIIWCKKFSNKLKEIGISNDLLSRYVDDMTVLPTVIPPGVRLEEGKLNMHEDLVEVDSKINDEKRTMDIVENIANSINTNIQVTYDIPSNYHDKMIPILDVKAGLTEYNEIKFKFYKKPIASDIVTMKSSALQMKQKFTILTQQGFSRLHNTSEDLEHERVESLNKFMQQLQLSGYSEKERENILRGSIKTYKNLKLKEITKERPFYRDKDFNKEEGESIKRMKKKTWYKGKDPTSKYKTVMFVDATPGDTLLKKLKETEDKHKISEDCRIKLVSKSGNKLVHLLEKKDPFAKKCNEIDCPPCESLGDEVRKTSKCRVDNVTYRGTCKTCEVEGKHRYYDGETARNLHIRSKEHINDFMKNYEKSWMLKHVIKEHDGIKENVKFTWKVVKKHMKPLERQVSEAVNISNKKDGETLNSKSEFNHQTIRRISLDGRPQKKFTCNTCGSMVKQHQELKEHMIMFHEKKQCKVCEYEAFGSKDLMYHTRRTHK